MRLTAARAIAGASLLLIGLGAALSPRAVRADDQKPYRIVDGKVNFATYNGYRRYGDACLRCHGPDGMGSSYAPNLTESLRHLSHDEFANTVINGRVNVSASSDKVMPAFGTNEDVVTYLDDIYAYLKGRSDGAIPRGRPQHLDKDDSRNS